MIEFKENVAQLLPYNRTRYIEYLDGDLDASSEWQAVSCGLPELNGELDLMKYIKTCSEIFEKIVLQLDDSNWIVNHDDKDLKWLPNDEKNLTHLRTLFQQNNIPNTFTGAIVFNKDELLKSSRDLISYPFAIFDKNGLLYKNLDVSHGKLPFIIKISGHQNIDFLSTDRALLKKILEEDLLSKFNVKYYRGTLF